MLYLLLITLLPHDLLFPLGDHGVKLSKCYGELSCVDYSKKMLDVNGKPEIFT